MKLLILLTSLFFTSVSFAATEIISQQQLLENQMSSNAYTIIDVRSKEEYDAGHVKGALNIPHDQIAENMAILKKLKDKTLVVYCRSGRRAALFEQELNNKGFNLRHLKGDFLSWQAAELPLIHK